MKKLLKENTDAIGALAKSLGMTGGKEEAVRETMGALSTLIQNKPNLKTALFDALTTGKFDNLKTALVTAGTEERRQGTETPAASPAPVAPTAEVVSEASQRVKKFVSYLFE